MKKRGTQYLIRKQRHELSIVSPESGYARLREQVRRTLLLGQQRIEQEKVRTYWRTGKYILDHIFHNGGKAHYGDFVIERLSKDLEIDKSVFKKMVTFARVFPKGAARHLLTWAHFRSLATVRDPNLRQLLLERAEKEKWTSHTLELKVRNAKRLKNTEPTDGKWSNILPPVKLGPFYTYRVIRPETIHSRAAELLVDFGFSYSQLLRILSDKRFNPETIVHGCPSTNGRWSLAKSEHASEDDLYTYKAFVERVIDGDTLVVEFDLGFGSRYSDTIRLKHIDAPELDTKEGRAAKRFVERRLAPCEFITIKSTRTQREKWGRYLGEVFFDDENQYLNQLLLDKGYAVRVRR